MSSRSIGGVVCFSLLCVGSGMGADSVLSMRVSVKEPCLVSLPVICVLKIRNEGSDKVDVFEPSLAAGTIVSLVRKTGSSEYLPSWSSSRMYDDRWVVTLMPGGEIEKRMDATAALGKELQVGAYECDVRYVFGAGPTYSITSWSNRFQIVEPTSVADRRAQQSLAEITSVLADETVTNRTERVLRWFGDFTRSNEGGSSGYLAQARLLVADVLGKDGRWLERAKHLEYLAKKPPEWLTADELLFRASSAYHKAGEYAKAISVWSGIGDQQSPRAKRLLEDVIRNREGIRRDEETGNNYPGKGPSEP